TADAVERRGAEAGRVERHGGVLPDLCAVHVEGAGRAVEGDGDVVPAAGGDGGDAVDDLFGGRRRADGEAHFAAGVVLRGEEHVVRRAGAEVEETRPIAVGAQIDPTGDRRGGEAVDDTGGQRHVLAGGAGEVDGVAEGAGRPGGAVHEGAVPAVERGVGGEGAGGFVELQVRDAGAGEGLHVGGGEGAAVDAEVVHLAVEVGVIRAPGFADV